jgi:hypothetical protein
MGEPVGFSYGKGHLPVRLPGEARVTIIRKTPLPKIADPRELNTVIDEDRDLVRVTFGEVLSSHLAAVDFVREATEIKVPRRFQRSLRRAFLRRGLRPCPSYLRSDANRFNASVPAYSKSPCPCRSRT